MFALLIVVTVLTSLVATGFSVAGIFFPGFIVRDGEASQTSRVFAYYAAARSVALLVLVLWAGFRADLAGLLWLGTLSGIVQLIDAAVGTQTSDMMKVWASLGLGVVQLLVVILALWFV